MSEREFDSADYLSALADYLSATDGLFKQISSFAWVGQTDVPLLEAVARATFCRQHEALSAVADLADVGRGYLAAPLLRPACEELILLTYLSSIERDQADRFVLALARLEAAANLAAQREFAGDDVMREIGFSLRFLAESEELGDEAGNDLRTLGDELGWPCRPRPVPSVRFFADQAGLLAEYDFLYHATSRFVHFKATELLRRVWGKPGSVTISSDHFADHWLAFSAYWGLWIHLGTTIQVLEFISVDAAGEEDPASEEDPAGEDVLDEAELFAAMERLPPKVPLVTAVEFVWPGRRPPWE